MSLESRIAKLERKIEVRKSVHNYGIVCDDGPYDPDAMLEHWDPDGWMSSDGVRRTGRRSLRAAFEGLRSTSNLHVFTNLDVDVDVDSDMAEVSFRGFEAPVINQEPVVGAFSHVIAARRISGKWVWVTWDQRVLFLRTARLGWVDGIDLVIPPRASDDESDDHTAIGQDTQEHEGDISES